MITGDNPLTAVSVARECGLINQAAHVFSPAFAQGGSSIPNSRLRWTCTDDSSWYLDEYSLRPTDPPPHHTVESVTEMSYNDYAIVVTGDVFRWMINHAPLETLQRVHFNFLALTVLTDSLFHLDACQSSGLRPHVSR